MAAIIIVTQSCSKEGNNVLNPWEQTKKEKVNSLATIQESSHQYLRRDTPYVSNLIDTPYRTIPVIPKSVKANENDMYRDTPYVSILVDTPYRKIQLVPKHDFNHGFLFRDTPYISLVVDTPYRRVLLSKK
jgi:hypothetical protein